MLVKLGPFDREYIEYPYLQWLNDAEVTKYMMTGTFPITLSQAEEYWEHMIRSDNHVIKTIILDDMSDMYHNNPIGTITLNNIDWISRTADLGLMLGNKICWGRGCGTDAIRLMTSYGFGDLHLSKIWAGIVSSNTASIRAFEKAGYECEAVLRDHLWCSGSQCDKLVMSAWTDTYMRVDSIDV